MGKTAKKKSKKAGNQPPKEFTPKEADRANDVEKPFDFGGLPDRDLKKNLGCG